MYNTIIDNGTIKKTVEAFGKLFNNIKINHRDANGSVDSILQVPLDWSSKSRWVRRIYELSSITDGPKVQIKLPRMGYEITRLSHDNSRQINQLTRVSASSDTGTYAMKRTPYILNFALYVLTNTSQELWSILEQILPFFDPDLSITLNDNADLQTKLSMTVNLEGLSFADNYEGPLKDSSSRDILCTMNFSVTTVFYGPVQTTGLIESVVINLHDMDVDAIGNVGSNDETVTVTPLVSQSSYEVSIPADSLVLVWRDGWSFLSSSSSEMANIHSLNVLGP